MRRPTKLTTLSRLLLAALLSCGLAVPVHAEDPPQEQTEEQASPQPTPTPQAGSLAAAASRIKLQKPEGDGGGSPVISDHNVKTAGEGASISQGGGTTMNSSPLSMPASPARSSTAAAQANTAADQLQAQRIKVENMEAQLADYDRQLAEPSPDPKYPKYSDSPQFRSPGVVDPAMGKRDQLAQQLDQERAKLQELEKKANQAGSRDAEPVPTATP